MTYKISVLFLGITSILSIAILYLLFFPISVIEPQQQPYRVITKEVSVGKYFVYEVNACKNVDTTAMIQRQFVGDVIYSLPDQNGNIQMGCSKSKVSIKVPDDIPPGRYHLELTVTYKLNVFSERTYHFTTEEFNVK